MRVGIEIERLVCFKAIDLGYYTIIILTLVGGLRGDCVRGLPRGELFELHNIASQGASFVRENVLDLAQLLVNIRRLGPRVEILIKIIHVQVVVHERSLPEFDHFQSDQKRYRDKVAEDEDPRACHGGYHVCFSLFREFAVQVHLEVGVVKIFQRPSGANTRT